MRCILNASLILILCCYAFQAQAGKHGSIAYEGNVATRAAIPDSFNASAKQSSSRDGHYARDTITALEIAIPNFYASNGGENGVGATATVRWQSERNGERLRRDRGAVESLVTDDRS